MSRHRDVRCMNYSDEYDGYDDVYGHSVEDDYCVSPSAEQFLFDRSKQQNIASFITEPDIVEDNEEIDDSSGLPNRMQPELSDLENSKLMSCMKTITNIIGNSVPDSILRERIIESNFEADVAVDRILNETPGAAAEKPIIKKEQLDTCPGATLEMPSIPTFTIPKFPFKKPQNSIDPPADHPSLSYNFDSLKSSASDNSNMSFTSLADMIADHTRTLSITVDKTSSQSDTNTQPFGSLADLTAHHLQKSCSLSSDSKPPASSLSSSSNFVIPKLCTPRNKGFVRNGTESLESLSIQDDKTLTLENTNVDTGTDNNVHALQNKLSSFHITSESNVYSHPHSSVETSDKTLSRIANIRTPSPDNWFIDLSTALKEAEQLNADDYPKYSPMLLTNRHLHNISPDISIHDTGIVSECCSFPITGITHIFNLRRLHKIKLPHSKRTASLFGRTLCRTWKLRRPAIKYQAQKYKTIVPFDFTTPYSRK